MVTVDDKEVRQLIAGGETQKVEFKENFDKETIETAVAFANADGGRILVGVNDRGAITGVPVGRETLKSWANEVSQSTEPTIIPDVESHVTEGKTVVLIKIAESPLKPISHKGACYLRLVNGNRKLTPKEIAELHLQTIGSSWDAYRARDSDVGSINLEKVTAYIRSANQTGRRRIAESPLHALGKLNLIREGKPTWAAILLFGREPQRFVSQARIHCGRFKNEITIIDDAVIEGDIIAQIDGAMDFVKKHLKLGFVITGKPKREEVWEYPLEAIREAVINAVCHRDYTELSDVQIRIYDDQLLVWNPGRLPLGITLNDLYKPHKSVLRNKLIAQIFFDIGLIERWGTGVRRIIESCRRQGLPEPVFEEQQGFRVIFRKTPAAEDLARMGLNDRQVKAVGYVAKKGSIGNKEYQELNGISKRIATLDLSDLVKKGIFARVGEGKRKLKYLLLSPEYPKSIQKSIQ